MFLLYHVLLLKNISMKSFFIFIVTCLFFVSCKKEESLLISQDQKNIEIIENGDVEI